MYSIIFPTYNVASFLKEAILCIKAQDYPEWELIIVDDGSSDDSYRIAAEEAGKDSRIRILRHEKNRGLSEARNSGLDSARGEYVLFLDPDDTVEPTLLSSLNQAMKRKTSAAGQGLSCDVLLYSFSEDYYNGDTVKYRKLHRTENRRLLRPAAIHEAVLSLEQDTMLGYAWNKAYRLAFLREQGIRFRTVPHIEDILFNLEVMEHCRSLVTMKAILYHYRNSGQARLTGKYLPEYFALQKQRIGTFYELQKRWAEEDDDPGRKERARTLSSGLYFRSFLSFFEREIDHGTKKKDILTQGEEECKSPLFTEFKDALPKGRSTALLYAPLAKGNVKAAYRRAKLIHEVKRRLPFLYARLKQTR